MAKLFPVTPGRTKKITRSQKKTKATEDNDIFLAGNESNFPAFLHQQDIIELLTRKQMLLYLSEFDQGILCLVACPALIKAGKDGHQ